MKRIICAILPLLLLLQFYSCSSTEENTETAKASETEAETVSETVAETETEKIKEVKLIYPENGAVVSLLTEEMTGWLESKSLDRLTELFDYTEKCEPVPVCFCWQYDGADYSHLCISKNADMSDAAVYLCTGDRLEVEDLYPGTKYFWQVISTENGANVRSAVGSFQTLQTPRTMKIDGVSNVRDLGGKTTADGRHVKYGIVFRGADFASLSDAGRKKAVFILGIKTELDLRNKVANGTSPLGDNIKYISVTAPYYGNIVEENYKQAIIEELRVFTDPDNFPVYFHCSLGRDRTGTLAFVLLALLGVNEEEIYTDYELSFFSDMGGYIDTTPCKTMVAQLDSLKTIMAPGNKKKPLADRISAKLMSFGLTEEEIEAIRANLLER